MAVLHMCHAGGVGGTGSVTHVSCVEQHQLILPVHAHLRETHLPARRAHPDGRWVTWQCYTCVTREELMAMAVLHMCHVGGVGYTLVTRTWQARVDTLVEC
jgi:hypothetical protein